MQKHHLYFCRIKTKYEYLTRQQLKILIKKFFAKITFVYTFIKVFYNFYFETKI